MHAQVQVVKTINASSDRAWRAISAIDGLDRWFTVIRDCHVTGKGVGATRTLQLANGDEIVDVIEEINNRQRRLRYARTKHPFPLSLYRGEVVVRSAGFGVSEISWTVDIDVDENARDAVTAFLHDALSGGVDGLEKDLS
jgi:hypothetical protein